MDEELPILDLSWTNTDKRPVLLEQLRSALYEIGFLNIKNAGVPPDTISRLTGLLPALFALPDDHKAKLSKLNSPHFLGDSGYAEETTLGKQDLREQFDFATELPVVYDSGIVTNGGSESGNGNVERDYSQLYWRLRGPNQWPVLPGFQEAFIAYHDAIQDLSYDFVHLIEEVLDIPVGTFDHFFGRQKPAGSEDALSNEASRSFLPPQHRIKLLRYPPSTDSNAVQGVGAHKDSSGWLTFLLQVGNEPGLEVLAADGNWIRAPPIEGTFVVNFGNAFEAATESAVKATTHRVIAPAPRSNVRYSVPFFQGLPLNMTVSEVRSFIPEHVKRMRKREQGDDDVSRFLDPRWDSLGQSQLRKWIRSHRDVGEKWYGKEVVEYYTG